MDSDRSGAALLGAAATVSIVGGVLVIGGQPVAAADFVVTNTNDSGAGSLRDAIAQANAAAGADTISFQAGVSGSIVLTSGQIVISDDLQIVGPGAAVLSVSGNGTSRVLYVYNPVTDPIVSISDLSIVDGSVTGGGGGILLGGGDLTLTDVTLTGNDASANGGAVAMSDGSLTLVDSVISGNTAGTDGGGIYIGDGYVSLDGVTVSDNTATSGNGGGMSLDDSYLTIVDSVISGNTAGTDGGGIYMEDTSAPTYITRTRITGNTAGEDGGGLNLYDPDHKVTIADSTISGNTADGNGGGIYVYSFDSEYLVVRNTTISGNTAGNLGGGVSLYAAGTKGSSGDYSARFIQSTISGNTAARGGGISIRYGYASLAHSTVAANTATAEGGGLFQYGADAYFELTHTIVADNSAPTGPDASGQVTADFSLIEAVDASLDLTDGGGNVTGVAPLLGALADNGGLTETHLPAAGSPAVGAGDPAWTGVLTVDQRGAARVVGVIDIGSVEVGASQPPTTTVAPTTVAPTTVAPTTVAPTTAPATSPTTTAPGASPALPATGNDSRMAISALLGSLLVAVGASVRRLARRT